MISQTTQNQIAKVRSALTHIRDERVVEGRANKEVLQAAILVAYHMETVTSVKELVEPFVRLTTLLGALNDGHRESRGSTYLHRAIVEHGVLNQALADEGSEALFRRWAFFHNKEA